MTIKNILFLGAGFSKNFGYSLTSELRTKLFNEKQIKNNKELFESIRDSIRENLNIEDVLEKYRSKSDQYNIIKDCLIEIFEETTNKLESNPNSLISENYDTYQQAEHNLQDFLNNFAVCFTTNFDFLIEQRFQRKVDKKIIPFGTKPLYSDAFQQGLYHDLTIRDKYENKKRLPSGNYNFDLNSRDIPYVKLHGSYNYIDSSGTIIIVGGDKIKRIEENELLKASYNCLRETLESKQYRLRICFIGYSFNDEHIDSLIEKSLKDDVIEKVLIIDPDASNLISKFPESLQKKFELHTEPLSKLFSGKWKRNFQKFFDFNDFQTK